MALAGVVLLAVVLRVWHLELLPFGYDEAVLLHFAEDMVREGKVPLSGPLASVGLSTPAHFIYIIAPVVALARDPMFVAAYLALINATGVALTSMLGWRAFGPWTGVIAGLLFAVNPSAVAYSRRIWQPDVLPSFAALLLVALDLAVIGRRPWWAAATIPIAVLAILVHSSFAPFLPLLVAPTIVLIATRRWLHLASGIAVALLCSVPFVLHEVQLEWQDYPNYRYYSSLHTFVDFDAIRWLLAVSTGWMALNDGVVPPGQRMLPQTVIDSGADLALALFAVGMLVALAQLARWKSTTARASRIRLAGLLLWVALPVAFTIRHWQPLFLHYFFAPLPAVFVLMASVCTSNVLARRAVRRSMNVVAVATVMVISVIQLASTVGGLTYQAMAAGTDLCFLHPLEVTQAIAADVAQFGHASGSTGAIVELDDWDSKPMAYLLRADFPDVYLPDTRLLSQTPTLIGNVGMGRVMPTRSLTRESTRTPAVLTASAQPEVRYTNGITLHKVLYSAQSTRDQHVLLAMNWSVAAASPRPVVWEMTLSGADGHILQAGSGVRQVPSALRDQSLVSWFAFDARRDHAPDDVAPGMYQLHIRLMDTSSEPRADVPFADTDGDPGQPVQLPVEISAFSHCDLPSTIP